MRRESRFLRFLYNSFIGGLLLKVIYNPFFSKMVGLFLATRCSAVMIDGFIKKNNIKMNRFKRVKYTSFNDFFVRELKDREVNQDSGCFISPCDGNLTIIKINPGSIFKVKNTEYTVKDLLGKEDSRFDGGWCLIFRIEAKDYHRYCYIDSGKKGENNIIKGKLHTVQEIATDKYKVFHTNSREWTEMNTDNFGTIIQIEVGALIVGKISNNHGCHSFKRGEEKGHFEFGGSTLILLVEEGRVKMKDEILKSSEDNIETPVFFGSVIGSKASFETEKSEQ